MRRVGDVARFIFYGRGARHDSGAMFVEDKVPDDHFGQFHTPSL
jgi:hypothetical protein